jgi:ATP-binding cassette subfamily B protein
VSVSSVAEAGAARPTPSVDDFRPPANRVAQLRRVPRLTWDALALVWAAGRAQLVATVVLQSIAAGAVAGQLLITREILRTLGSVGNGASVSGLYPWLAALAGFTAALGALGAFTMYEQKLLVELASRHAFDRIIDVAAAVDLEAFESADFYDQLQRARNSGLYRLIDMVTSVVTLATGLLMSLGIAVVLFVLQPLLLVFVALAAVFPLVATIRNSREAYAFEYAMTAESRERQYLMELLTERDPAKEIRTFGAAPFLRVRYGALTEERVRRLRTFLRARLRVALTGSLGGMLGSAVALGALLLLLSSGRIAVASALTAAFAMQQLGSRLTVLTASVGRLIESGMFIDDFQAFLALSAEQARTSEGKSSRRRAAEPFRSLEVDDVVFRYPGSDALVLDGVSLEVGAGEVVALVGENGSGKTTLVKLICQLYRPERGRILWNGSDALHLAPEEIRGETTVLFQDFVQYHLSARDNIVLGRPELEAREDVLRAAAVRGGADGFLSSLPRGYETRLGREFYGGHELSVGQWQRLALARAFFRDGSLLVLDEPTASLDPRAEAELYAQMRELASGRSVLLVSHRLSSVRTADRIYMLERGRVIEAGDHDSLLGLGGRYADLFALQAEAYLSRASAI